MAAETLSVPVIDVSSLFAKDEGNSMSKKATIKEIGNACRDWGFFYIVGHNVDSTVIQKFKDECYEFFEKPKEFKKTISRQPGNSKGYFDQELTKQKIDWKEVFDYGADIMNDTRGIDVHGVNLWPEGMPTFKSTLVDFFEIFFDLSRELLLALFASLNVDPAELKMETIGSYENSLARINFYPKCPDPKSYLGVGPHSDAGCLTVLLQDDRISSLQVERDGKFYDIPPVKDSFVINLGDIAQVWSNDLYKAPVHRVLTSQESERLSFVLFTSLSYDDIVKPLKECTSEDNPPLYKEFTFGEFIKEKIFGNYADLGEELQITHYRIKQ